MVAIGATGSIDANLLEKTFASCISPAAADRRSLNPENNTGRGKPRAQIARIGAHPGGAVRRQSLAPADLARRP
jgi:hypothetical protein